MWLGKQQRRAHDAGEGQVGKVTIGGEQVAVLLDSERRGLEVYSPGGYRWMPRAGQKVLVIQGKGEIPCVAGVRQGESAPEWVTVETIGRSKLELRPEKTVLEGARVELVGEVYVNGEKLEDMIARIAQAVMAGAE